MKAKIIPIRTVPRPSIREKLLKAELEHVRLLARNALYKYASHKVGCPSRTSREDDMTLAEEDCMCGLYDTINSFHKVG